MRLLVVEDENDVANALRLGLSREGYAIDLAEYGEDAIDFLSINDYDLLILDLNLPDKDGLEICKLAREVSPSLLILILTARENKKDIIKGLDFGADDYLTKPFHFEELLARIRALFRRNLPTRKPVFKIQDIILDPIHKEVWQSNQKLVITKKEYGILDYLIRHPDEVISQEEILEHVWGTNVNAFSNTVRVHIQSLRKKLRDNPKSPMYIETVIGIGYRFLSNQANSPD